MQNKWKLFVLTLFWEISGQESNRNGSFGGTIYPLEWKRFEMMSQNQPSSVVTGSLLGVQHRRPAITYTDSLKFVRSQMQNGKRIIL